MLAFEACCSSNADGCATFFTQAGEIDLDFTAAIRLVLVYAHLLLCVFALHRVLVTDWRLLQDRVRHREMKRAHRQLVWLLAALWASGLAIVALDTGLHLVQLAARPKLLVKLLCVALLTLNGLLLRVWCFPRLSRRASLGGGEAAFLVVCGAFSTTSWLMAAFLGVARPLQSWPLSQTLVLYGGVMALALPVALLTEARWRRLRRQRRVQRFEQTTPAPEKLAVPEPRPTAAAVQVRQMRGGSPARPQAS